MTVGKRQIVSILLIFAAGPLGGQTTQSLITGQVADSRSGQPVKAATVDWRGSEDGQAGRATTSSSGFFTLPLLSPGTYRLRIAAGGYQPQELHNVEVPVASSLDVRVGLRPLHDVWEQGLYKSVLPQGGRGVVTFIGPDLDAGRTMAYTVPDLRPGGLEAAVSDVISRRWLRELPLAGRDAYSMLVTLAGVTADAGTARGLGLSINGQRPTASNFLLDGAENNNYLTSGPLTSLPPEALEEYRATFSNFAAEYGRTSGYLANAVTRAGGNRWHGLAYFYAKDEALNANGFQQNRQGISRRELRESQPGFTVTGPLRREKLFASGAVEFFRNRQQEDPLTLQLPSSAYKFYTKPGGVSRRLLDQFSGSLPDAGSQPIATVTVSPPSSLDRWNTLLRLDRHFDGGKHRLMGRLMAARVHRPDFLWTPYADLVSPLFETTLGAAASWISATRPDMTLEVRASVLNDDLHWDRPYAQIPTLESADDVLLPGSPAFYAYRNRVNTTEVGGNLQRVFERHMLKAGAGLLTRRLSGLLTAGRDGRYLYDSYFDFGADLPSLFQAMVAREDLPRLQTPEYNRRYSNNQFYLFAQDSWKVNARLTVNAGVRYENFGVPKNTGAEQDAFVRLGGGQSFPERLVDAELVFPSAGGQPLYDADRNDFAGRMGVSWQLPGSGTTVFRAAYGLFYDRGFDNLWQNLRSNGIALYTAVASMPLPVQQALAEFKGGQVEGFPAPTLYQPGIRDPYSHSLFAGIERKIGDSLTAQVSYLGSMSHKVLTTDMVNRPFSVAADFNVNPLGRYNPDLPTISYRANQGSSAYHAMSTVLRYRTRMVEFMGSYTWSRLIDNQSDPLAGDFFDLSYTRATFLQDRVGVAAFSRQFDSGADRGNSDYDQRHNLVLGGVSDLTLLRGWRVSWLAAFRSGFPYTVLGPSGGTLGVETFYSRRADLIAPAAAQVHRPAEGGRVLLDEGAFQTPLPWRQGNTGRNAFRGPGLFNLDFSLAKIFQIRESLRLTFRADAYNVVNHVNLGAPSATLGEEKFGFAAFGRTGHDAGFPALVPLNDTPRVVQMMLRIEF